VDLRRRERLAIEARIPEKFVHCRLDNFEVYHSVKGRRQLNHELSRPHEVAKKFVKQYPKVKRGLLFMGPCGVGKTHLAVAIINELIREKGVPCLFYDFQDLMKEIQHSYDRETKTTELAVLEPVINREVLVLDDLGARKVSDWMLDTLAYIVNQRYNHQRITILTSNWMDNPPRPDEETLTDRIGVRLRSRLREMCQEFEIISEDYRAKRKTRIFGCS